MTFLLRATGPALVSWPVCALVVVWSTVLSLLASGSTATGSLAARALVAGLAGLAACAVTALAWWGGLRKLEGKPRIALALLVVAVAALVRGFVVQALFVALGFAAGTTEGYVSRMVPSLFTISFAFLVGASGVAAVNAYRDTAGLLVAEQKRLVALLESSASGIEERQSDALEQVQKRLDAEVRTLALETAPSAVTSLESLAGDVVRPLSHSLAREIPQWDADVPDAAPRVRWVDVWRDPVPSAAIRPLVLPAALLVIAMPAAALVYAPVNGATTVLTALFVLVGVLALGRLWLVRRPPRRAGLVWLAVLAILLVAAFFTSRAGALGERGDPSAGAIPSITFFVVPVFGLIVATVSMMGARMRSITEELAATTAQLKWNLARIHTQQWEQSGRLSRALHGPVQSMLHARLLRLRRELDSGEVSTVGLEDLERDLQEALASALAPAQPRPLAEVLTDVADTWEGLAAVSWMVRPAAAEPIDHDPLCTQVLADLASEAVSNAVRHGKATRVDVDVNLDSAADDLVCLRVTDNGSVPDSEGAGLGTTLLTRCTYDWSLSRGPTTLVARLPCAAHADLAQEAR